MSSQYGRGKGGASRFSQMTGKGGTLRRAGLAQGAPCGGWWRWGRRGEMLVRFVRKSGEGREGGGEAPRERSLKRSALKRIMVPKRGSTCVRSTARALKGPPPPSPPQPRRPAARALATLLAWQV